jgi:hypothetical protein
VGLRKRVKDFKINSAGWYFFENVYVDDTQDEDSNSVASGRSHE